MVLFIGNNDAINNPTLFTPWTLIHVAVSSCIYSFLNIYLKHPNSMYITIILHSIYELKDFYYSYINIELTGRDSNSWLNSIGDSLGCIAGIYLSHIFGSQLIINFIIILLAIVTCTYLKYD